MTSAEPNYQRRLKMAIPRFVCRLALLCFVAAVPAALAQTDYSSSSNDSDVLNRLSELNSQVVMLFKQERFTEALALAKDALALSESVFLEGPPMARSLRNLGGVYHGIGAYDLALPLYQRELTIRETVRPPDDSETAETLNNLAMLYQDMGADDKALPLFQRALAIREKVPKAKDASTANTLGHLANLYLDIGAYNQALPLLQRELAIREKLGPNDASTAATLTRLGDVYLRMNFYDRALAAFQRALAINVEATGYESRATARSLGRLARTYESLRDNDMALALHQRAIHINDQILGPAHPSTAFSLNALAEFYRSTGVTDKALLLYQRALLVGLAQRSVPSGVELIRIVGTNLCALSSDARPPRMEDAIFYCKLAVNALDSQRSRLKGLDPELRAAFSRMTGGSYQLLARLLTQQGRLAEAEQVLLVLKDAEYAEFVRGPPAEESDSMTPGEKQVADEINALGDSLGKVYAALNSSALTSEALTPLKERQAVLQQQLLAKLSEISARLKPKDGDIAAALAPQDTRLTRLVSKLMSPTFGESNVVVMYVPEERLTTVLVTSSSGPAALQLPVGTSTLNPLIASLRQAIRERKSYREPAQALYKHLIAPVQVHLRTRKLEPKTLMLYLTGRLRYLPFAALVDDKGGHLIERYRLAVLTAAARDKADAAPISQWSVTAFGSTQPSAGLSALPAVKDELDGIVRTASNPKGTLPGQSLLDGQFTRAAWQGMLDAQPGAGNTRSSVIHVATHFQSQPGDWNRSFLLLGTGERYEISELDKAMSANLDDVDLLTLSACATEITDKADGNEFEGLGAVFQKKGAKAVIGTLWPVQDEGGAALMKAFYVARGEQRQMSKAAALQNAQVQLLTGKIKSVNPSVDLTHPYYWAPFILMGNWL